MRKVLLLKTKVVTIPRYIIKTRKKMNNECCNGNCNQGRDCPSRTKTLTDEEIAQIWKNMPPDNDSGLAFARAILRKAQEK